MTEPASPLAPAVSPLTEADPNSVNDFIERINEIFNKPSLDISDAELRVMVEYYQKERHRFKLESQLKEQRPRATPKPKAPPTSVADAIAMINSQADMI